MAIAERRPGNAQASVFNLRNLIRKRTLSTTEVASSEFVSMSFSADDSILLTLGGAPDWTLACWSWDKAKVRAAPLPSTYTARAVAVVTPVRARVCVFSFWPP